MWIRPGWHCLLISGFWIRRSCTCVVFLLLIQALLAGPVSALANGDFAAGLDHWSTDGPVETQLGELVLADAGGLDAAAWQVTPVLAPRSRLEFDMLAGLSGFTPSDPFGFPDVFGASIYLLDDPIGFAPDSGTSIAAVSVLSLDGGGAFDSAARVTASALGGDWLHVEIEFDSPTLYMAPTFELFELAFSPGDSEVRIDGVALTAVPEPGTAMLVGLGLALVALGRRSTHSV